MDINMPHNYWLHNDTQSVAMCVEANWEGLDRGVMLV